MRYLVSLFVVLVACGGHDLGDIDDVVGAACVDDRDCAYRCYKGREFPGGFCSIPCASDRDCPADTYCMENSGGVCMFVCPEFDCDRLGRGWECRNRSRRGGGNIEVCTGN